MIHATSKAVLIAWDMGLGPTFRTDGTRAHALYRVYRDGVATGETHAEAFYDTSVRRGAVYHYRVAAVAEDGSESAVGPTFTVHVPRRRPDDRIPPTIPQKLTTTGWSPSADSGSGVLAYFVERDSGPQPWAVLWNSGEDGPTSGKRHEWTDESGVKEAYRLRALDGALNLSEPSGLAAGGGFLRGDINLFVEYINAVQPDALVAGSQVANVVLARYQDGMPPGYEAFSWRSDSDGEGGIIPQPMSLAFNETVAISEAMGWDHLTPNILQGFIYEDAPEDGNESGGLIRGTYELTISWPSAEDLHDPAYLYLLEEHTDSYYFTLLEVKDPETEEYVLEFHCPSGDPADPSWTVQAERSHRVFFGVLFSPCYTVGPWPGYIEKSFQPVDLGYLACANLPVDGAVRDAEHLAVLQDQWDTSFAGYVALEGGYSEPWDVTFGSPDNDAHDFPQVFPGGDAADTMTVVLGGEGGATMTTRRPSYVGELATHIYGWAPPDVWPAATDRETSWWAWDDQGYYALWPIQYHERVDFVYWYCRTLA